MKQHKESNTDQKSIERREKKNIKSVFKLLVLKTQEQRKKKRRREISTINTNPKDPQK